eukprot:1377363-Amorphochlora_amoeboformis.AAC.1
MRLGNRKKSPHRDQKSFKYHLSTTSLTAENINRDSQKKMAAIAEPKMWADCVADFTFITVNNGKLTDTVGEHPSLSTGPGIP